MLVNVLDGIRAEAAGTKYANVYGSNTSDVPTIWQARSRAYIHLFLKVMFGIVDFTDREQFITDGSRDGGIDGYYIDSNNKTIYLIQSKFRNTEDNFERKPIEISEILSMEIKRILGGEERGEDGTVYNGKIKGLQRKISQLADIGLYKYVIVIIANIQRIKDSELRRLSDGLDYTVYNFSRAYVELLFPVLSGTLFKASGTSIFLDLSSKTTGAKLGYLVNVGDFACDITVVFVPTIEIARIMSLYRNSILTYNPRSYLEFDGARVNDAIRDTIVSSHDNDFALLNNGITIVCDKSSVNEQSGVKHRAQLFLVNPQIINGGQTAYTLSRIYDQAEPSQRKNIFAGKEVLVKIIALTRLRSGSVGPAEKFNLIEKISLATNSQTAVTASDRSSNDELFSEMQRLLFEHYGLLYERKRGEFTDGVRAGYIDPIDIVNRVAFSRVYLAANGLADRAIRRKMTPDLMGGVSALSREKLDRAVFGLGALEEFRGKRQELVKKRYLEIAPRIHAASILTRELSADPFSDGKRAAMRVQSYWGGFVQFLNENRYRFIRNYVDPTSGETNSEINYSRKVVGKDLIDAITFYFSEIANSRYQSDEVD